MTKLGSFTNTCLLAALLACGLGQYGTAAAKDIDLSNAVVVVPDGLSAPRTRPPAPGRGSAKSNAARMGGLTSLAGSRRAGDRPWPRPALRLVPARASRSDSRRCPREGEGRIPHPNQGRWQRRSGRGDRRQRRARRALRRRPPAPRAAPCSPAGLPCPTELNVTTAPKYPLRGHQLGYRPKTNSYDAWDCRPVGAVHPRPGRLRLATRSS